MRKKRQRSDQRELDGERQGPVRHRAGAAPEEQRQAEQQRDEHGARRVSDPAPDVLYGARQGQREHELETLVGHLAHGARGDRYHDQKCRTGAQQRRRKRGLKLQALGECHLRHERGQHDGRCDAGKREPGQAASTRLEQHIASEYQSRGHESKPVRPRGTGAVRRG